MMPIWKLEQDDPSSTTGAAVNTRANSMDTEEARTDHSSSTPPLFPSHPDTPLPHLSQVVPMGNAGATTGASGPVGNRRGKPSRIGGGEGKS
jgi:hypothetical protein